jgi:hypothetical protein
VDARITKTGLRGVSGACRLGRKNQGGKMLTSYKERLTKWLAVKYPNTSLLSCKAQKGSECRADYCDSCQSESCHGCLLKVTDCPGITWVGCDFVEGGE